MEFLKNNLAIIISVVTILSGCFNIYQYIENRKLKKYGTEKDLKRRQASLEKLHNDHNDPVLKPMRLGEIAKDQNEFAYREKCLKAEIEYLEKILNK